MISTGGTNRAEDDGLGFPLSFCPAGGLQQSSGQDKGEPTVLELEAREYSVTALVDRAAEFLGRNYLTVTAASQQCSPEAQMIRLRRPMRLTRESCQDVIAQLLSTQGWVLSIVNPGAEIYQWVHQDNAMQAGSIPSGPVLKPEEVLAHPYRRIPVVTKLELDYLRVDILNHRLSSMFQLREVGYAVLTNHSGGNGTEPAGGIVALWGMNCSVAKALSLLQAADKERARSRVERQEKGRVLLPHTASPRGCSKRTHPLS